jgi:resolvase-like protein
MVMAWSVDRLGRSLQDLVGFLSDIHALKIDLYLHQQGIDTRCRAGAHRLYIGKNVAKIHVQPFRADYRPLKSAIDFSGQLPFMALKDSPEAFRCSRYCGTSGHKSANLSIPI